MKLFFSKNDNNEIIVQIQRGTTQQTFTYSEMISQLLLEPTIEESEFVDILPEEQEKINAMLAKILEVFKTEEDDDEFIF